MKSSDNLTGSSQMVNWKVGPQDSILGILPLKCRIDISHQKETHRAWNMCHSQKQLILTVYWKKCPRRSTFTVRKVMHITTVSKLTRMETESESMKIRKRER